MSKDELTIVFGYGMIALLLVILWVAAALATANTYQKKGHSRTVGLVAGFLLGPLGLLLALISPADQAAQVDQRLRAGELRRCPFCDELIRPAATVCPHCQRDIPPAS